MKLLHIFDSLYQNHFFTTFIIIAIILLTVGFVVMLFLGLKDKQKNEKKEKVVEDQKETSFLEKEDALKEDVTFEIPLLTKNLEDFKKNLEEEIKKESQNIVLKPEEKEKMENLEEKKSPVLDQEAIEDTAMVNILIPEEDLEIPKAK